MELFYKLPQEMCRASGFVSKTDGSMIPLSSNAKIVYAYMLHRNDYFVRQLGNDHFETQTTIADACGVEYRTVMRIMKDLTKHGVIIAHLSKTDHSGYVRYFYESVTTDITFWYGKKDNPSFGKDVTIKKEVVDTKPFKEHTDHNGFEDEFLTSIGD